MSNILSAAAAVTLGLSTQSKAAVVYDGGVSTNNYTVINTFTGANAGNIGYGDDYNTGQTGTIQLNGFSFIGGTQGTNPAGSTAMLFIDFYTTSGVLATTIVPSASEVTGFGTHTLAASDFPVGGLTVPAAGYVIFSPFTYDSSSPSFSLAGGGSGPTVGTNNSALSAMVAPDGNGTRVLSTGAYFPAGFFGPTPQRATFTLSAVPEPTTLGLIVPAALLALRRRRA